MASSSIDEALTQLDTLKLGLSHAYYSVSKALRLNKLIDLLKGENLSLETPIYLLGKSYSVADDASDAEKQQVLSDLVRHLQSTMWASYRTNFTPLIVGETQLKSDAGWGCTMRSLQMALAQALQRHLLGPDFVWPIHDDSSTSIDPTDSSLNTSSQQQDELCSLLQYFWDTPSPSSAFSIHNLCRYGASCGVHIGRWLGPWVACKAAEAAAEHLLPSDLGLKVAVLASTGGGTPILYRGTYDSYFFTSTTSAASAATPKKKKGLLLLVPLVLGIGSTINPVYIPQLTALLSLPQSVGVVGGRPGSSLYFVGCQEDSALYLDPHQVQEAATSEEDWHTYQCDALRTVSLATIDPSLALAFYCGSCDEYKDLCMRLSDANGGKGYPLVCITDTEDDGDEGEVNDSWAADEVSEDDDEAAVENGHNGHTSEHVGDVTKGDDDDIIEEEASKVMRRESSSAQWELL